MTSRGRRVAGGAALGMAAAALAAGAALSRRYYRTMPGPSRPVHERVVAAWTPLWREAAAAAEWPALRRSPVWRGEGVPRGDGAPVLLVQGYLTRPGYLQPLHDWLARLGHAPEIVDLGWNADCLDVAAGHLAARVRAAHAAGGRPVHLVGHSLGGLLARAVAVGEPARVASVASLGSPFRGLRIHPALALAVRATRAAVRARRGRGVYPECQTLACPCATVRALAAPAAGAVRHLAVATRDDGVADWRYCVDASGGDVAVVGGSHIGLVVNPAVYAALARHLAAGGGAPGG
jgi:triacylglycerol lipase